MLYFTLLNPGCQWRMLPRILLLGKVYIITSVNGRMKASLRTPLMLYVLILGKNESERQPQAWGSLTQEV